MESKEKVFTQIQPPTTTYKEDPHAVLSQSEQRTYDEVLGHFTKLEPVYSIPNFEKGELMDEEKFWLSRECILRYLRATRWKASAAIQRLESTLKWRREFGLYDLVNANHVEPEAVTGKAILFGYDVVGKPAFYMIPSRQNTDGATRQIQFTIWVLERGIDLMEPGVETLAFLINFGDRGKNPPLSTAITILHILQDHYPERLGLALIINIPFLVNAFFKIITPLLDSVTRQKMKFNPEVLKDGLFTPDMIMKDWWGGEPDFEYVHEKYWPHLVSLCEDRVTTWTKNWNALGAKVGTSEWAYKKGIIPGSIPDPVECDTDTKGQQVTVTEVSAPPAIVEEESQEGVEPAAKLKDVKAVTKSSTEPTDFRNGAHVVTNDGAHISSQGGPSTTAVSGAGAVAGGGGGGVNSGGENGGSGGGNGGDGGGNGGDGGGSGGDGGE